MTEVITEEIAEVITEQQNENSLNIDKADSLEIISIINEEDKTVANAVETKLPEIAKAVDVIADRMQNGGRLVYCGAGTSGRQGVLDACECYPTFGVDETNVIAVIAGGPGAMVKTQEGAEDDIRSAVRDLINIDFCNRDVLIAIAACGNTPYVIAAAEYAKKTGAAVIALTCAGLTKLSEIVDIDISPVTGPEVVTGSTRMKSGTAQKMVLNMISTAVMIKLGKVYKNFMVDLRITNQKLAKRAIRIITKTTGVSEEEASLALENCNNSIKHSIVSILCKVDMNEADRLLKDNGGNVGRVVERVNGR